VRAVTARIVHYHVGRRVIWTRKSHIGSCTPTRCRGEGAGATGAASTGTTSNASSTMATNSTISMMANQRPGHWYRPPPNATNPSRNLALSSSALSQRACAHASEFWRSKQAITTGTRGAHRQEAFRIGKELGVAVRPVRREHYKVSSGQGESVHIHVLGESSGDHTGGAEADGLENTSLHKRKLIEFVPGEGISGSMVRACTLDLGANVFNKTRLAENKDQRPKGGGHTVCLARPEEQQTVACLARGVGSVDDGSHQRLGVCLARRGTKLGHESAEELEQPFFGARPCRQQPAWKLCAVLKVGIIPAQPWTR
jgi:hypothetical protein